MNQPQHVSPGAPLSDREIEIIQLAAGGATNGSIARSLHLSVDTIKTHLHRIHVKLQVTTRTAAVLAAIREGYLPNPAPELDRVPGEENMPDHPPLPPLVVEKPPVHVDKNRAGYLPTRRISCTHCLYYRRTTYDWPLTGFHLCERGGLRVYVVWTPQ